MPQVLREISGISYITKQRFACVQDNKGSIFIYNASNDSLEREIVFAGAGDYEDIAIVHRDAYVLRANGTIYHIKRYLKKSFIVTGYQTALSTRENPEGMCYDKKHKRLLIAAKAPDPSDKNLRVVYAFDIRKKKLDDTPAITIVLSGKEWEEIAENKKLQPSAIAIHPRTKEIYLLDGEFPKLLVLKNDGTYKELYELDPLQFTLPEGITFSAKGEMFISNEGRVWGEGNILKVRLR